MTMTDDTGRSDDAAAADPAVAPTTPTTPRPVRARVRSWAMRPRRLVVRVHRWLSFALLAWLVVISTTGAWLVVHDPVESWLHADRYATTPGDVGLEAAAGAAVAAAPTGATLDSAQTRRNSRGVYKIDVSVPVDAPSDTGDAGAEPAAPEPRSLTYFVDPGSGRVNGAADGEAGATAWLYRGHMYLWQDHGVLGVFDSTSGWCRADAAGAEPGGVKGLACAVIPAGDDMIAWFAVGWIVVLSTGFYVWYWPGVRRWASALLVRRRRGAFALHLSVHKAVGLVVWVPLTMIAFTGAAFAFPNMKSWYQNVTPAHRGLELWTAPDGLVSTPVGGTSRLGIDRIADVVATRYPARRLDAISPPADAAGTYSAWVTRGFSPWTREDSAGNVFMVFDQYTGQVLYDGTPGAGNVFDQVWDDYSFPLHAGDVGGTPTRVLWVVFALTPLGLGGTGLTMHLIRRRKRARRRAASR